jgi:hypothetical protein
MPPAFQPVQRQKLPMPMQAVNHAGSFASIRVFD